VPHLFITQLTMILKNPAGRDEVAPSVSRLVEISGEMSCVERAQRTIVERLIEASTKPHPQTQQQQSSSLSSRNDKRRRSRSRSPASSKPSKRSSHPAPASNSSSRAAPLLLSSSSGPSSSTPGGKESMTVRVPIQQVCLFALYRFFCSALCFLN